MVRSNEPLVQSDCRRRFGEQLRASLRSRGITQVALADRLGGIAQSAVSAWVTGETAPANSVVFDVERILELPPGFLSRHLGFVPVGATVFCSVAESIAADPLLDDVHRQALLALYREFTLGTSPR